MKWLRYWNDAHHNTDLYLMEQGPLPSRSQLVWWMPSVNLWPSVVVSGFSICAKGTAGHVVSRHSISATWGPRDIISLVIHKMGITGLSNLFCPVDLEANLASPFLILDMCNDFKLRCVIFYLGSSLHIIPLWFFHEMGNQNLLLLKLLVEVLRNKKRNQSTSSWLSTLLASLGLCHLSLWFSIETLNTMSSS
jgi:hypothetical protein